VLFVHLDQKDWIALLKASAGRRDGENFQPALTMLAATVEAGTVRLPLSHIHYIETNQRRPYENRLALVELMARLSQFRTVAPFWTLVREELADSIATHFESLIVPAPPKPFGRGVDHAFGTTFLRDEVQALYDRYGTPAMGARDILEWGALADHPEHDTGHDHPIDHMKREVQKRVDSYEQTRKLRTNSGYHCGPKSRDVAHAQAFLNWQDEIFAAFRKAGVGRVPFGNKQAISWFLESIPTIAAQTELLRLKEETTQQRWTVNDLRDVEALCVAVVYADVVVTEKSWAAMIRRSGLDQRFGTTVLESVTELPEELVNASRAG